MKEKILVIVGLIVVVGLASLLVVSMNRKTEQTTPANLATSTIPTTPLPSPSSTPVISPVPPISPNPPIPSSLKDPVVSECRSTGCSGQICAGENVFSTCEYKSEYACYRSARCERQVSGECGWTETQELKQCLANPGAGQY